MPIIKKIVHNNAELFIWEIIEDETTLLNLIDKRLINGLVKLKKEKARLQWLASRVLLTQVLHQKNIQFDGSDKDDYGKPFLSNCDWNFSISHSGNFAALIISKDNFIGVDIETKFKQTFRLKEKFSTKNELSFIGDNIKKSSLIWSAKESIYKAYGKKKLLFKEDMRLIEQKEGVFNFQFSKTNSGLNIQFIIEKGFIMTFLDFNIPNS